MSSSDILCSCNTHILNEWYSRHEKTLTMQLINNYFTIVNIELSYVKHNSLGVHIRIVLNLHYYYGETTIPLGLELSVSNR